MCLGRFFAGEIPRIHRELQHHKSIFEQGLAKARIVAFVFRRFYRKVEHGYEPQGPICRKKQSFHLRCNSSDPYPTSSETTFGFTLCTGRLSRTISRHGSSNNGIVISEASPVMHFASEFAVRRRMSNRDRSSRSKIYRAVTAPISQFLAGGSGGPAGSCS